MAKRREPIDDMIDAHVWMARKFRKSENGMVGLIDDLAAKPEEKRNPRDAIPAHAGQLVPQQSAAAHATNRDRLADNVPFMRKAP